MLHHLAEHGLHAILGVAQEMAHSVLYHCRDSALDELQLILQVSIVQLLIGLCRSGW